MSAAIGLLGSIFIIVILGLIAILTIGLTYDENQNNNQSNDDKNDNKKLKELEELKKRDLLNNLNGKIKDNKSEEYSDLYMNSNVIFVNKDNIFDIKLPYHFVSPKKSLINNKVYELDNSAKNYIAFYLYDKHISIIEKRNSFTFKYDVHNIIDMDNINKDYYSLLDYKNVYDDESDKSLSVFTKPVKLKNFNQHFEDDQINKLLTKFKEFMLNNNLKDEELSQYLKNQNKKIQLDSEQLQKFKKDYERKIRKIKNQNRQELLNKLNELKDEIDSVNPNKSYFYNEIKDLIK